MGPSFRTLFLTWPSLPSLTPSARLQNPGFLAPSGPGLKFISPGLLSGLRDPLPPLQNPPFLTPSGSKIRTPLSSFLTPSGSRIRTPLSSYPFRARIRTPFSSYPSGQGSELPHLLTPSGSRIRTPLSSYPFRARIRTPFSYPFRVKDQNSLVFLPLQGQGSEVPCLSYPCRVKPTIAQFSLSGSPLRTLVFLHIQGSASDLRPGAVCFSCLLCQQTQGGDRDRLLTVSSGCGPAGVPLRHGGQKNAAAAVMVSVKPWQETHKARGAPSLPSPFIPPSPQDSWRKAGERVLAAGPSSHRSDAGDSWVDDGWKGRSWGSSEGGDWQGRSVPSPAPAVDGWLPGAPGLTAVDRELHSLTFPSQLAKHTRNATLPTVPVLIAVDTKLHSLTFPSQRTKREKCSTHCVPVPTAVHTE